MSESSDIRIELELAAKASELCGSVFDDPSDENIDLAIQCLSSLLGITSNLDIKQYGRTAQATLRKTKKFRSYERRKEEAKFAYEFAHRLPGVNRQ